METLKPSIYILYPQYMHMFTMLISLSTYIGEAIESLCAWSRLVAGSLCGGGGGDTVQWPHPPSLLRPGAGAA